MNLSDLGLIFVVFLSYSDFLAASITTHNQNGADVTTSRCHGDTPSDPTLLTRCTMGGVVHDREKRFHLNTWPGFTDRL